MAGGRSCTRSMAAPERPSDERHATPTRSTARDGGPDGALVRTAGDVFAMPFAADSFDLIVCQAAFKNFRQPRAALTEMHRVLRPGGTAVIQDMNRDASRADIAREVRGMRLSRVNAFMTRLTLSTMLRRRAYSPARFERLVALTPFRFCVTHVSGLALQGGLRKPAAGWRWPRVWRRRCGWRP